MSTHVRSFMYHMTLRLGASVGDITQCTKIDKPLVV